MEHEDVVSSITDEIRSLVRLARESSIEDFTADTHALAKYAFGDTDTLMISVNGIDYRDETSNPLTVLIQDAMSAKTVHQFDPIAFLIESYCPQVHDGMGLQLDSSAKGIPIDGDERAALDRAYAALQSGMDRLRVYEAERLQAQS